MQELLSTRFVAAGRPMQGLLCTANNRESPGRFTSIGFIVLAVVTVVTFVTGTTVVTIFFIVVTDRLHRYKILVVLLGIEASAGNGKAFVFRTSGRKSHC